MRPRTLVGLLLLTTSLVPLALAAQDAIAAAMPAPNGSCGSHVLVPFDDSGARGSVIGRFVNEGPPAAGRVCLFDDSGTKRYDVTVSFAAGERRDVAFEAPPGVYRYRAEFGTPTGGATGSGVLSTRWCLTGTHDVHFAFHVGPSLAGMTSSGGSCTLPANLGLGLVGVVASGGTLAWGQLPALGGAALYTRLVRPELLDDAVRSRIHSLVEREPGIHTEDVMRTLALAEGQTAYHLHVLSREKMLISHRVGWRRHWFVRGRHTGAQIRALAALRDPTRRRIYDAVVADPGASLSTVARSAGVSVPQGSRAARALENAGLIERNAAGRALALRPLRSPAEIYGSA